MRRQDGIPFDGFGTVLEMLQRADAPFREKILRNLRQRDPALAKRLEQSLQALQQRAMTKTAVKKDDSRALLERSQRAAQTRNYGN